VICFDQRHVVFGVRCRCNARAMQVQCSCNVQHNVTQCDTTCQVSPFLKDSVKAALNSALLRSSGWGLGQAVVIHSDNPFTKHTFYVHSLSSYCLFIYHISMRSFINFGGRLNRGPAQLTPSS